MKDSTDLLRAEIAREEALLAKEKKELEDMTKNAKRAETERKRLMKNVSASGHSDPIMDPANAVY